MISANYGDSAGALAKSLDVRAIAQLGLDHYLVGVWDRHRELHPTTAFIVSEDGVIPLKLPGSFAYGRPTPNPDSDPDEFVNWGPVSNPTHAERAVDLLGRWVFFTLAGLVTGRDDFILAATLLEDV